MKQLLIIGARGWGREVYNAMLQDKRGVIWIYGNKRFP